jgi:hypothetical protein
MEATKEAALLLELAIARSRANGLTDEETKARICRTLERAKQEIVSLEEHDARAGLGLVFGGRSTTDTERSSKAQGQAADQTNGQRERDLLREA